MQKPRGRDAGKHEASKKNGHDFREEKENREKEVMETALLAGHILLENGAEISRVEETFDRICRHYGVEWGKAFVVSDGLV